MRFLYDSIVGARTPGYTGCILADDMGLGCAGPCAFNPKTLIYMYNQSYGSLGVHPKPYGTCRPDALAHG